MPRSGIRPAVGTGRTGRLSSRGSGTAIGVAILFPVLMLFIMAIDSMTSVSRSGEVVQTAADRAYTAAGFALSTSQLNERSLERASDTLDRARLTAGPGGIPIGRPYVVGAIGVAGGTPDQDEQCCRAAVTGG